MFHCTYYRDLFSGQYYAAFEQHSYINIANLIPMIPAYNHLSCWYLTVESTLWVEELHKLLMSGKQNLQTF